MASFNLSSFVETAATAYPTRDAIVLGQHRLTYAALNAAANRVASLLVGRGVKPGDKVALMCPNTPDFPIVYNGILKAGATVVPLNVLLKGPEVAYHLQDSDAVALFAFAGTEQLPIGREAEAGFAQAPECAHLFLIGGGGATTSGAAESYEDAVGGAADTFETAATDEDDPAVILYTSGTTGKPKGAVLRHRNMRDNALISEKIFGCDASRPDTYLGVLPLFHSFGQTVVQNGAAAFGGTVVLMPRFDPSAALKTMLDESVTFFAGVPTMYWSLLNALDASVDVAALASNLRVAVAGGSALPVQVHTEFERKFNVVVSEGYGLSETSPIAAFKPDGAPARPGSIGMPIPGVEMKLIEPGSWDEIAWSEDAIGEIAIRGHNVGAGYHERPDATAEAINAGGWFRTGDLGRRDADGWYFIVDRVKDLIIRGGYNVYPRELEEVLLTHPAISLAAVIGVPDERLGEEIKAFVIPKDGADANEAEIVAWCRERMGSHKYPRSVEVVTSLPMTATGKILKRELK